VCGDLDESCLACDDSRQIDISLEEPGAKIVRARFAIDGNYFGQVCRNLIRQPFDITARRQPNNAHAR
jgi:hypothetical protein